MKVGLIGGSGLYDIEGLDIVDDILLSTPFGDPSSYYKIGNINGIEIIFLSRHGDTHSLPPHKINYRANIWGFKSLGVKRIISVNAVGGISSLLQPGDIVIPDQIIDFTFGCRISTFYELDKVVHVDFTTPYCYQMRDCIDNAAKKIGINILNSGTYICVNGPRLETASEIKFFSSIGADIVGMTAMPEAVLSRECEICFASICVVTNFAAGISRDKLTTTEVLETMKTSKDKIKSIIRETIRIIPPERNCPCKDALKDAEL